MEAAKEVIAVKQKATEEVKAAQDKFDEALEAIQKLEADSEQDNAQIEQLKARVSELEHAVSQLSNDTAAAKATAEQLRHQVKSQQVELERVHKDQEQDRIKHRERMEKLTAEHAATQDKTNKERDAAVMQAAELKGQSAALKAQNTELLAALADGQEKRKGKS